MAKAFTNNLSNIRAVLTVVCISVLLPTYISAQQVRSEVDTTSINIGERVNYKIIVTSDSLPQIEFPGKKSFGDWEVVDSLSTDTIKSKLYEVIKSYGLIGFDEKIKSIPRQRVNVDGKILNISPIPMEVRSVEVDTISKEFYNNKALEQVEGFTDISWMWKYLFPLLALSVLGYFIYRSIGKRIKTARKSKLKPYEKAVHFIKESLSLDPASSGAYKEYYSGLTTTLKHYVEEQLELSVMESTSAQLLEKLKHYIDEYDVKINSNLLDKLGGTLYNSDLTKFAKMTPDPEALDRDASIIEDFIFNIENNLPYKILEERAIKEQIIKNQYLKKRNRRKKIAISSAIGAFLIVVVITVYKYGFIGTFDKITAHPTRKLMDMNWVTADYGFPPLVVSTPGVLKRVDMDIPDEQKPMTKSVDVFSMGSLAKNFYADIESTHFNRPLDSTSVVTVLKTSVFSKIELMGGQNITSNKDDFTTPNGAEGVKYYGSFTSDKFGSKFAGEYEVLIFITEENIVSIHLIYDGDDRYASKIVNKIESSVDFKLQSE